MFRTWPTLVLPHLRRNRPISVLEIGVGDGKAARWLLRTVLQQPSDHYVGIDPWYDDDKRYHAVLKSLSEWSSRAEILRTTTEHAHLILDNFSLAFIDGNHTSAWVQKDSHFAWPLLRSEGLMIWDDYGDRHDYQKEVQAGVQHFLAGLDSGTFQFLWQDRKQYAVQKIGQCPTT